MFWSFNTKGAIAENVFINCHYCFITCICPDLRCKQKFKCERFTLTFKQSNVKINSLQSDDRFECSYRSGHATVISKSKTAKKDFFQKLLTFLGGIEPCGRGKGIYTPFASPSM